MNVIRLSFWILLAGFLLTVGCAIHKHSDPLADWKISLSRDSDKLDQAIKEDCWDYIHKLPREQQGGLTKYDIWFYENSTGQHAVKFTVSTKGFIGDVLWDHLLVYDANNKRIKAMKYKSGRSLS